MSVAERLTPFVLIAVIIVLVISLFVPRRGHRPFHGTHLDGDDR
jgi:hypothetical protein